jgi:CPA1 family monovalent cation:H+ antiporter
MVGNYGTKVGMSATTRVSVGDFWEYAAFVVNSVIFLLIGLEVKAGHFVELAAGVAAAVVVVFVGRAAAVAMSTAVINRFSRPLESRWPGVLVWGGLRGSLSMALALSLPPDFPGRQLLLTLVFGVVAFSLIVQGLTMKPLLRHWGLTVLDPGMKAFEMRRGELLAKQRAMEELEELEGRGFISHETADRLRPRLQEETAFLRSEVSHFFKSEEGIRRQEEDVARRRLRDAEKQAVKDAFRNGVISEESMQELVAAIDGEGDALARDEDAPESDNPPA